MCHQVSNLEDFSIEAQCRLVFLYSHLSTMPIYHMFSLDLPLWFYKCFEKLQLRFFWRGHYDAKGWHCITHILWQTRFGTMHGCRIR